MIVVLWPVLAIWLGISTVAKLVAILVGADGSSPTILSVTFPIKSIVSLFLVMPASAVTVNSDAGLLWNTSFGRTS